jgi:hypothetical protein
MDLDELTRLEQAATPGPWSYVEPEDEGLGSWLCRLSEEGYAEPSGFLAGTDGIEDTDANLIVALRNAAPALIAAAKAAPRWIPVTERLPEYDPKGYNAYAVVWHPMLGGPAHRGEAEITQDGTWIDPDPNIDPDDGLTITWISRITHWSILLPLPNDPT